MIKQSYFIGRHCERTIVQLLWTTSLCTLTALLIVLSTVITSGTVLGQGTDGDTVIDELDQSTEEAIEAPEQVDVEPIARDEEIAERLITILRATEWFQEPRVSVRDGVAFLDGSTETDEYRTWAGNLARNTQDVVAVVNRIVVLERSPWDFAPAFNELRTIGRNTLQILPLMLFGLFILALA